MKNVLGQIVLLIFLTTCGQRTSEQILKKTDSLRVSSQPTVNNSAELFQDSHFTYSNLDSINEDMFRDTTEKKDYKYIKSVKRFTKEHCKFFKTGCRGYFVDDHVFLVSKQKSLNGITPVIIHDSKDFNYYHSDLFTLDNSFRKIDSTTVSLTGSGVQSDEPSIYYETKVYSKFTVDKIITTEVEYWHYSDNDSTVTKDSTIFHRQINKDGKIKLLKKEKVI